MRLLHTAAAAALLGALLLAGCPRRDKAAGDAMPTMPDVRKSTPSLKDEGGKPAKPRRAERIRAPKDFPLKFVPLPAGAQPKVEIEGMLPRPFIAGTVEWMIPFDYAQGFSAAVKDLDAQLKRAGYERIIALTADKEPNYTPGQGAPPKYAEGVKTYVDKERLSCFYLRYEFRRGEDGAADTETYNLQVLKFAEPQPMGAGATTAPIE